MTDRPESFMQMLWERRSCRMFRERPVEPELVDRLLRAALLAPSGRNREPCEIYVTADPRTIQALADAKDHGSRFLAGAPLALAVAAQEALTDTWVEDASIVLTYIQLAAQSLGLGSCWIQIRGRHADAAGSISSEDVVRRILGIGGDRRVQALVALGYPAESRPGKTETQLRWDSVCYVDRKGKQGVEG